MKLGRTAQVLTAGAIALGSAVAAFVMPSEAAPEWASSRRMIQDQLRAEGGVRPLSPEAARVARSALSLTGDPLAPPDTALPAGQGVSRIDLGEAGMVEVAVLDSRRRDDAAYRLLAPGGAPAYSPVVIERGEPRPTVAVSYARSFDTQGQGDALDMSITPRAGLSLGPAGSAAGAGAEVRIGQYLHGDPDARPRWYVFAGADRRALMYDPSHGIDLASAMQLSERQVVGDAQAGVAVRIGEADLSLAYVRREYRHVAGVTAFDESEEFGAVSVNWRW